MVSNISGAIPHAAYQMQRLGLRPNIRAPEFVILAGEVISAGVCARLPFYSERGWVASALHPQGMLKSFDVYVSNLNRQKSRRKPYISYTDYYGPHCKVQNYLPT